MGIRFMLQNMSGLNYCCRKLLIFNTSRLINNNGIFLQPYRSRHHLVFQISSPHNKTVIQKSRLLLNKERQFIYRLASTNVNTPEAKPVTPNSESPKISESVPVNTGAGGTESSKAVIDESLIPPAPLSEPVDIPVLEFVSTGLKEPTFESLGLGSLWPSGILQTIFEYIHVNLEIPWWQTIVLVTLITRILLFPINLSARRDTIHMTNNLPMMTKFQQDITAARTSGDYYAVATLTQEFQQFLQDKKINMLGFLKTAVIQGPVFLSMFYALRGMCQAPVESLKTEGLFWFTDLTASDPYYILPVVLSASLFAVIELGAEGTPKATSHATKWVMRGVPLIVFVFSMNFSSCITWYWTISNFILLAQVGFLRIPVVAEFFNLPKRITPDQTKLTKNLGFIEGFKEGFTNAKVQSMIKERQRLNLVEFQKAGSGAVPRTFKRNPLLQKEKK